ncbi:EGF domain-specific O-linked N-acetylglucosamine transferase [Artemisia annua]|uniref:EGF domain-specific O-linked N-acetylglucosamine transferase n=1 Tax=Artemisia annua TaxID=35608 RepID=A0A2U1MAN1_ARTAN|nr:EGF domain-specific O-linked N-acetylglucosamine transferase [Artemisia annua]
MRLITPVRILQENIGTAKSCNHTHKVPVIVFSSGLIGNLFHEISEIIIPLFITSHHFKSSVQFMITDYQPWFVKKYNRILTQLSSYQVIGGGLNTTSAHCFPGAVVGLKYHDNLALDPNSIPGGYTMLDFKQFLRETYSLKIKNANEIKKPVLLLISRKTSRTFLNENEMVQMMEKMGFQVFVTNTKEMLNLDKFSKVVNSCNVMVGAHGAGLTNAVFLPEGAVLVQVVPYALTWASDTYYGQPAPKMGLKYLEYKTVAEESSLMGSYGPHDPVIADPQSLYSRGYQAVRAIYVDGQNMTINLTKFRATLVEALVHLGHRPLTRKS